MKAYTTKTGVTQYKPSLADLMDAVERDDNSGFCLACGEEQGGIEPDGHDAHCESCGARQVYGAEELMILKLYHE